MAFRCPIGVMQGRLLPPVDGKIQRFPNVRWREEFSLAAAAGVSMIEWIYEVYGADDNPIASDDGLEELRSLSRDHDVAVRSLCADYFMDRPLLDSPKEGAAALGWLMNRCRQSGIRRMVLPFVDSSRLLDFDAVDCAVGILISAAAGAREAGVELHLETDLPPEAFRALMVRLPADVFFVNYDSGNSASLGYSVEEEFAAYGSRVGSLHIKDRTRGGGTVPLGKGNAAFSALRSALAGVDYTRDIILQVSRGREGDELEWITEMRRRVEEILG